MRMLILFIMVLTLAAIGLMPLEISNTAAAQTDSITVRIERFPRPPYSGATYYIYERDGEVICTKLKVCNKYDDCSTTYKKGVFKEEEDIETGDPYGREGPFVISKAKQRKHVCLTRFKLIR